jgi:signal transduction histidine kinase
MGSRLEKPECTMRRHPTQRSRRGLWFLSIALPLAGLALLYPVCLALLRGWPPMVAYAAIGVLMIGAVVAFSTAIFRLIGRQDRHLARQYAELELRYATERQLRAQLEALHQASLAIASTRTSEEVLQRLVELARELIGARYAALGVLGPHGFIDAFYTAGLTAAERAQLGALPQGHGLLEVILAEGVTLRVPDIAADTRRVGFPPGHPPMRNLLGVPVAHAGQVVGNLYLTDRVTEGDGPADGAEFSPEDERLLAMLASHAAAVIEQARLAEQVRTLALAAERERIRMDLHDGAIQSIYSVNLELETAVEEVDVDPAAAQRRIDLAIDRLGNVMKDIRGYILGLESGHVAQSLPEAMTALLAETRAHTLLETELHVEGDGVLHLPPALVQELLQMAREAVSNVVHHARAGRMWATVHATDYEVHLTIADNGIGFDFRSACSPGHEGLRNLHERARGLGGTLVVESALGAGTAIDMTLPLRIAAWEESHG